MTECSLVLPEQAFCRGIMKIHVETIWEDKFHFAQRITRTGLLSYVVSDLFHVFIGEVMRISFYSRHYFIFNDTLRHIPVRTEDDLVKVPVKHHGVMAHLSDDNYHIKYFFFSIHHMQHEFRKVNDNKIAGWFLRHPAHPVHIEQ